MNKALKNKKAHRLPLTKMSPRPSESEEAREKKLMDALLAKIRPKDGR